MGRLIDMCIDDKFGVKTDFIGRRKKRRIKQNGMSLISSNDNIQQLKQNSYKNIIAGKDNVPPQILGGISK